MVVLYNMNSKETILQENYEEYYESALYALQQKKYNTATTLFFKALVALCDLFILRNEDFIPSSHTKRFRLLKEKYPKMYEIIDRDFPFYQDSYTQKMDRETANLLKEDVKETKEMLE